MFIGHYGAGLAAKRAAPFSLGLLFLAVQFLDLLWPTFLLLHIEQATINTQSKATVPLLFTYYPYSHSLLMALVWSLLFGGIYWLLKRNTRYAFILGLCVFSHWILDLIVHLPDLPLYIGDNAPKVGLQLWNYPIVENIVEGAIFIVGLLLYLRSTRAKNKIGRYSFWGLIALLILVHIVNIFSPPPTSINIVAWGAQGMWLFVILAFWVDKNRGPERDAMEQQRLNAS
jgi:hypothetical protein